MPHGTPFTRVEHTRQHGVEVILEGETLAAAAERARAICHVQKLTFIPLYDDDAIITLDPVP